MAASEASPRDHYGASVETLLPIIYDELRRLARQQMAQEPPGQTLQPTALVHEVYLRLAGDKPDGWASRAQFFAAAAEAMRRILVERARARRAEKRGGGRRGFSLQELDAVVEPDPDEMIALDEALGRLEAEDPRMGDVVKLRYFAGLTVDEIAVTLAISPRTVHREWDTAKAWLRVEVEKGT